MPTDRAPGAAAHDGLTEFQVEVAQLVSTLPGSAGFLLAGGAALLAQHLISRPTQDLDFFTSRGRGEVGAARAAFEAAAAERGWKVRQVRETRTFVRLVVTGAEDLVVDIALDAPPGRPPHVSVAGPTFDPRNWPAARSSHSSTGRRARDFERVRPCVPLRQGSAARAGGRGRRRLRSSCLRRHAGYALRFTDDELPVPPSRVAALRAFFAEWADELRAR